MADQDEEVVPQEGTQEETAPAEEGMETPDGMMPEGEKEAE